MSAEQDGRVGPVVSAHNSRVGAEMRDPRSLRHGGPYLQCKPASSHFFIWLPG